MKKDRLRAAINRSGIKQTRIAELLEVNVNTVSRWLSGDFNPTDDKKLKLAEILGTTFAYLMGETDNPNIGSTLLLEETPLPGLSDKTRQGIESMKVALLTGYKHEGPGLLGETTDMYQEEKLIQSPEDKKTIVKMDFPHSSDQIIKVPIFERAYSACCGSGFPNADQIYSYAEDFIEMPTNFIGQVSPDPDKRPFMICAEGDSMIQTGITDGSQLLINPT